jgi:hypothetical protein
LADWNKAVHICRLGRVIGLLVMVLEGRSLGRGLTNNDMTRRIVMAIPVASGTLSGVLDMAHELIRCLH